MKLDIVLFGVTGFTGKHCLPILQDLCNSKNRSLKWGVAGRSEKKIEDTLQEAGLNDIPVIIADVNDENSLRKMAQKAKLIINCCGPFRFYGEAVVKACVEEKAHYIDVTGEVQFMEEMQLKYNKQAEKNGVYIVSACGIDSIPNDLGVVFLEKNFGGVVNSVESFLQGGVDGDFSGPVGNFATWESAVFFLAFTNELKKIRKQLFPKRLPELKPKLKQKFLPRLSPLVDGWVVPFPGTDEPVINRSQRYFYEVQSKRPIQFKTYFVASSLLYVLLLAILGPIVLILSKFSLGRYLLLQFPEIFSFGLFSKQPPSEKTIQKTWFQITLLAEGWKDNDTSNKPNKRMVAKIQGRNPGYGTTCVCLALAAILILTEKDKLPLKGGVYPPGAAFAKTSLIEELCDNGVTFEIVSKE